MGEANQIDFTDDEALRETKVAKFLELSTAMLRKQRRDGTGRPFLKIGYTVRYLKSDLEKYIEQCRRTKIEPQPQKNPKRKSRKSA